MAITASAKSATQGRSQLQDSGQTRANLDAAMQTLLYEWRAVACEMYFDAADLFIMVEIEYRAAVAAYDQYQSKIKKLQQSSKPINQIAGYAAENKRQWELYDREVRNSGGSASAVSNPSDFARRQRDDVLAVVDTLSFICDTAMGDDAYDPARLNAKTGHL